MSFSTELNGWVAPFLCMTKVSVESNGAIIGGSLIGCMSGERNWRGDSVL